MTLAEDGLTYQNTVYDDHGKAYSPLATLHVTLTVTVDPLAQSYLSVLHFSNKGGGSGGGGRTRAHPPCGRGRAVLVKVLSPFLVFSQHS